MQTLGRGTPISQVSDTFENSIAALDRSRAADLTELTTVRSAKFDSLQRDRTRLVAKLGADHPRVQALDRNIAQHRVLVPVLQTEAAVAAVATPKGDAKSWAIHGFVVYPTRAPVPGITLALYTGQTWERRFGFACTDQRGYFQLSVADASNGGSFSLHLLRDSKTLQVESTAVTIAAGKFEYREIVLNSRMSSSCGPPDGSQSQGPPSILEKP
jgi:hypothetical protein